MISRQAKQSLSSSIRNISFELDEDDTLCHKVSCYRCSSCSSICFDKYNINNNIRFGLYCIFLALVQIIQVSTRSIDLLFWTNIIHLIFLSNIVLECNQFILHEAVKTFNVYYSIVNVIISIIAFEIDSGYWQIYNSYVMGDAVATIDDILLIFIVCITDGYNVDKYLKSIFCSIVLFHYVYFHWYQAIETSISLHETATLFGKSLHWHTVGLATTINVCIFVLTQIYSIVQYGNKLILVPTFVSFELTNYNAVYASISHRNNISTINYNYRNESDKGERNWYDF